jgi:hypothetical protein
MSDDIDMLTGAADMGVIRTSQGRWRQVSRAEPTPTPTRPIPEREWARTNEGCCYYLHIEKGMSYSAIAAETMKTENTVKQAVHKAKKALKRMKTEPGFSWPALLDELREMWDPPGLSEEDSLDEDEQQLTYAELAEKYADDEDDDANEGEGFFEEDPIEDDYHA